MESTSSPRSPIVGKETFNVEYHPLRWKTVLGWESEGIVKVIRIGRKCYLLRAQVTYRLKLGSMYQDQDLIFPGEFGEPLRCPQNIVIDHYKPILKKAKLPNLRLYDLRHSAASLLFAAGAPVKVVSEVLGHASVNLTQNTYIHVIPGMHQQAVRNMGEMLRTAKMGTG